MNMEHPEEEKILDDDEDKNDNGIDEEESNYVGMRQSIKDSKTVERLELHWDNEKLYSKFKKREES